MDHPQPCPRATVQRRRAPAGQALLELALLASVLLALGMGVTDFGRSFGTADAINGASREAARQAAYYDANTSSNPLYSDDGGILAIARNELGASGTGARLDLAPVPHACFGTSAPPPAAYPSATDRGYLYVCRTAAAANADGRDHVAVSIVWRMRLLTPIVGTTGVPLLHATVDATRQGP